MKISLVTNYRALFAFIRWIKFLLEFHFARAASSAESLFAHITRAYITHTHTNTYTQMRACVHAEREDGGAAERWKRTGEREKEEKCRGIGISREHYYHWK